MSRSMFFCTLPMVLRGRSSTKITRFGSLNFASRVSSRPSTSLLGQRGLAALHHDGGDALAEIGMRHADDGALDDAGDRVDLALDLLRIDVVAAGDDEVLAAADDVDVAAARRSCRGRR